MSMSAASTRYLVPLNTILIFNQGATIIFPGGGFGIYLFPHGSADNFITCLYRTVLDKKYYTPPPPRRMNGGPLIF